MARESYGLRAPKQRASRSLRRHTGAPRDMRGTDCGIFRRRARRASGVVAMRKLTLGLWALLALGAGLATQVVAQDVGPAPTPPTATEPAVAPGEDALDAAKKRGKLLWGADPEGGAPYVFADPNEPERTIGFEVDIANELGRELGLPVEMVPLQWSSIYADVARGAVDFGMNGLEVNDQSRKQGLFTRPYYLLSLIHI